MKIPDSYHPQAEIKIVAYTASWCSDCSRSKRLLKNSGFEFCEIDIEELPSAEEAMRSINGGSGKIPTILIESIYGRDILVEPSDSLLSQTLQRHSVPLPSTD